MEKTKVHNLIIVDASGSMGSIYAQALAGINETIKTIKNVHKKDSNVEQYLTLLSFANGGEKLQYVYRHKNIEEATFITDRDYQLRGEGDENDSRGWNGGEVKQLIDERRTNG